MKDEFYIVLPSNSSMDVYPANTTTRFTTYLPHEIVLTGTWSVALTEIQIPLTLQHVTPRSVDRIISFLPKSLDDVQDMSISHIPSGVYNNIDHLLDQINKLNDVMCEHLDFSVGSGNCVKISKRCDCENDHFIALPKKLKKMLGFDAGDEPIRVKDIAFARYPANIRNGLPSYIMVYSNVLEPHVTGDVQTPLLRALTLNLERFSYGGFQVKNFSPPMYLPVLLSSFRSIEVDIRDQFGEPIPFDYGTLTVTLHFKRI